MKKIKEWSRQNLISIILVVLFVLIHIATHNVDDIFIYYGATGMRYLNGEYYRWFTCLFLHYGLRHLLANSIALLSAGSLLSPFLKSRHTLFIFLAGGILSEASYSIVVSERVYDIGASSGIFALIACLLVCYLRFQDQFHFAWYRPDIIIVLVYFVFANTSVTAFLVHSFGFIAGILISFVMVSTGQINPTGHPEQ